MSIAAHEKVIEDMTERHLRLLDDVLVRLEKDVIQVINGAPQKGGKLFDTKWAVEVRPRLQNAIRRNYMNWAHETVEGYNEAVASVNTMLTEFGVSTMVSSGVVQQLKNLTFRGFEDIGNRFFETLASEIYQNTLVGRSLEDMISTVRGQINGIYQQADTQEVADLVKAAKKHIGTERGDKAVELLHTKYAADRLGNNMRRYAGQMVHDGLSQFDAAIIKRAGDEAGAEKWKYVGETVRDSRDWCIAHKGRVMTEDEMVDEWANNSWQGKSGSDPFINRGGYNCQHRFIPVFAK